MIKIGKTTAVEKNIPELSRAKSTSLKIDAGSTPSYGNGKKAECHGGWSKNWLIRVSRIMRGSEKLTKKKERNAHETHAKNEKLQRRLTIARWSTEFQISSGKRERNGMNEAKRKNFQRRNLRSRWENVLRGRGCSLTSAYGSIPSNFYLSISVYRDIQGVAKRIVVTTVNQIRNETLIR